MNFLPGWFPGAVAAASGPTSIVQQANNTGFTVDISVPVGVIAGDLLVILNFSDGSSAPAAVTPSGFTNIVNLVGANSRMMASYKLANGSEGGANIPGMDAGGAGFEQWAIYVFRGNVPASLLTPSTPNAQQTIGNPTAQNVAASGGVAPLVVFGCYAAQGTINPRTFSPAKDGEINPDIDTYLAYKIYNLSPANVSVDMDDEGGSNFLGSFYIQMA